MTNLTLILAFVFAIYAVGKRNNGAAVGILIFSMMIWPEYLRVFVGVMSISIPRLVGIFILIKIISKGLHKKVKSNKIDKIVIFGWIWVIIASAFAGSESSHLTQMTGRGLDTVLMYFVARYSIQNINDLKAIYFSLALTAITMCLLALGETLNSFSPYNYFIQYREWSWFEKGDEYRLGLKRVKASTSVHIYFGMTMMVITGLLWSMRGYAKNKFMFKVAIISSLLAALTSLSSGPWLACAFLIVCGLYEKKTKFIKPTLIMLGIFAVLLELVSNRHFYNLIDYIALDSHTAWYRTKLLEVAFSNLNEFWLFGVGSAMPHHWGMQLDGRLHIDIVNHFLLIALYGGIPAAYLYILAHVKAIKNGIKIWKKDTDKKQKSLIFGLLATLIALDFSSMSVSLFGPVLLLSFIMLGMTVTLTQSISDERKNKVSKNDE